ISVEGVFGKAGAEQYTIKETNHPDYRVGDSIWIEDYGSRLVLSTEIGDFSGQTLFTRYMLGGTILDAGLSGQVIDSNSAFIASGDWLNFVTDSKGQSTGISSVLKRVNGPGSKIISELRQIKVNDVYQRAFNLPLQFNQVIQSAELEFFETPGGVLRVAEDESGYLVIIESTDPLFKVGAKVIVDDVEYDPETRSYIPATDGEIRIRIAVNDETNNRVTDYELSTGETIRVKQGKVMLTSNSIYKDAEVVFDSQVKDQIDAIRFKPTTGLVRGDYTLYCLAAACDPNNLEQADVVIVNSSGVITYANSDGFYTGDRVEYKNGRLVSQSYEIAHGKPLNRTDFIYDSDERLIQSSTTEYDLASGKLKSHISSNTFYERTGSLDLTTYSVGFRDNGAMESISLFVLNSAFETIQNKAYQLKKGSTYDGTTRLLKTELTAQLGTHISTSYLNRDNLAVATKALRSDGTVKRISIYEYDSDDALRKTRTHLGDGSISLDSGDFATGVSAAGLMSDVTYYGKPSYRGDAQGPILGSVKMVNGRPSDVTLFQLDSVDDSIILHTDSYKKPTGSGSGFYDTVAALKGAVVNTGSWLTSRSYYDEAGERAIKSVALNRKQEVQGVTTYDYRDTAGCGGYNTATHSETDCTTSYAAWGTLSNYVTGPQTSVTRYHYESDADFSTAHTGYGALAPPAQYDSYTTSDETPYDNLEQRYTGSGMSVTYSLDDVTIAGSGLGTRNEYNQADQLDRVWSYTSKSTYDTYGVIMQQETLLMNDYPASKREATYFDQDGIMVRTASAGTDAHNGAFANVQTYQDEVAVSGSQSRSVNASGGGLSTTTNIFDALGRLTQTITISPSAGTTTTTITSYAPQAIYSGGVLVGFQSVAVAESFTMTGKTNGSGSSTFSGGVKVGSTSHTITGSANDVSESWTTESFDAAGNPRLTRTKTTSYDEKGAHDSVTIVTHGPSQTVSVSESESSITTIWSAGYDAAQASNIYAGFSIVEKETDDDDGFYKRKVYSCGSGFVCVDLYFSEDSQGNPLAAVTLKYQRSGKELEFIEYSSYGELKSEDTHIYAPWSSELTDWAEQSLQEIEAIEADIQSFYIDAGNELANIEFAVDGDVPTAKFYHLAEFWKLRSELEAMQQKYGNWISNANSQSAGSGYYTQWYSSPTYKSVDEMIGSLGGEWATLVAEIKRDAAVEEDQGLVDSALRAYLADLLSGFQGEYSAWMGSWNALAQQDPWTARSGFSGGDLNAVGHGHSGNGCWFHGFPHGSEITDPWSLEGLMT
ncbi:MAG TPA: hypothetical protein DIS66_05610, partial [Candidatus Omnitrophica bacterium]|nr:hypothetical protein [Candidatus Omnitrophota bacterium]